MLRIMLTGLMLMASAPAWALSCLQPPIPGTTITSNFGLRFHPVHKTWRSHNGTDMRATMYTKVNAAHAGQVTFSGYMGGGGNAVIVLGQDGTQTRYLHLSKSGVRPGMIVAAGQQIALSGNTGHASAAPHLHFESRLDGGTRPVDARSMLCQSLPEKNGAGPDKSGNGSPAPGGQANPTSSSGTADASFNSTPDFNGFEGMSDQDIFKIETERRFLNSDWHIKMGGCGNDINQTAIDGQVHEGVDCKKFFRQELLSMSALQNWIAERKMLSKERVEAMRATRAIDQIKASKVVNLDALRSAALRSAN